MPTNIFQRTVTPDKPRILAEERIFVYVPKATNMTPGIASFVSRDFRVNNGVVQLTWPMSMQIERLTDPLIQPSRIQVLDDEFEHTNEVSELVNPVTGVRYTTDKAEVQLNRKHRNAFARPDFVQLDDEHDFTSEEDENGYVKYYLKRNDPFEEPSLIQVDRNDFGKSEDIINIHWPYAYDPTRGTTRTNGFGLMRLAANSAGYLKYDSRGNTELDLSKVHQAELPYMSTAPTYGANADTGFVDINNFVDPTTGLALRDAQGHTKLSITKEAVGLSKVANKSFDEYIYTDFGSSMRKHFEDQFGLKLDKATWNLLFGDWNPPNVSKNTVQKWFESLEAMDESLRETLQTLRLFLGYFEDLPALTALHKADSTTYGSTAFIMNTQSYWAVRTQNVNKMFAIDAEAQNAEIPKDKQGKYQYGIYLTGSKESGKRFIWTETSKKFVEFDSNALWLDYFLATDEEYTEFIKDLSGIADGTKIGIRETDQVYIVTAGTPVLQSDKVYYEWWDTCIQNLSFFDFVEKRADAFEPNGVASPGSSGFWAQSDHIHPTDETRLAKDVFVNTEIKVQSLFTDNDESDFVVHLYKEDDSLIRTLNIPWVRKAQTIHNWNGNGEYIDTVESSEHFWYGTAEEFAQQKDTIPDNSTIFVDDNEDFFVGDFMSRQDLDLQGITIDPYVPDERFVITDQHEVDSLVGVPLTIERVLVNGKTRFKIKAIAGLIGDGHLVKTQVVDDKVTIRSVSVTNDRVIVSANDSIDASTIHPDALITTDRSGASTKLNANQVVITQSNNIVKTYDTGKQVGRVLVANGSGGIGLQTFTKNGALLISDMNGMTETDIHPTNVLATALGMDEVVLPAGEIVIMQEGNIVGTYGTGTIENKMLVTDGAGGVKVSNIPANALLWTDQDGMPAKFPMQASDAGKFIGVDAQGKPTLQMAPAAPSSLPIKTYTTDPGDQAVGTVLCILSSAPATYSKGVIYVW